MLYVDFFWVWAIGAMFAVAAARQLKEEKDIWINKYFVTLLIFMALDFGGSGLVLLWTNPAWETMQVFWMLEDIPLWFILLWFSCNIILPIISYWLSIKYIKKNKIYNAMVLSIIGYFLFFFILFYGWDGTGYQRFFYDATGTIFNPHWNDRIPWTKGNVLSAPIMGFSWFYSNIAVTLYILGVIFLGPHFYICIKWAVNAIRSDQKLKDKVPSKDIKLPLSIAFGALLTVGLALLMALFAGLIGWIFMLVINDSLAILGIIIGIPLSFVLSYLFILKENKIFHKVFNKFFYL